MISVAFIPPLGLERFMLNGQAVMGLAQLAGNQTYMTALKGAATSRIFMLDNGAAEGEAVTPLDLKRVADILRPTEVVLPDVLGDYSATIDAVKFYIKQNHIEGRSYMGVATGGCFDDAIACINSYAKYGCIKTIGIPRLLCDYEPAIRLDIANWITENRPKRFNIHFLGMNFKWPREVCYADKYCLGQVRSIDTSAPYVYAIEGRSIDDNGPPPMKSAYYFKHGWGPSQVDFRLIDQNEKTLLRWAAGLK